MRMRTTPLYPFGRLVPLNDSTQGLVEQRNEALRYAALTIQDRERLIERLEFDISAQCTRTSCLEPEVNELAAIALVLLGVTADV